jgi:RNA-binding protein YlmH
MHQMTVYEHFRPEEAPLIDRFTDWKNQTERRYKPRLTDFLDPRQQFILKSVIGNNGDVHVVFSGGYPGSERKRALILPAYVPYDETQFKLSFVEAVFASRFSSLHHSSLLGALLGTGVDRDKIGDLLVSERHAQFICAKEIESWLLLNLTAAGRTPVTCRTIDPASLIHKTESWIENEGTVASLRLDAVLSELYHLPRAKTAAFISHDLVKVNWQVIGKKDFEIREGDMISLRGYGRSKILAVEGLTKKNKIRLRYGKLG